MAPVEVRTSAAAALRRRARRSRTTTSSILSVPRRTTRPWTVAIIPLLIATAACSSTEISTATSPATSPVTGSTNTVTASTPKRTGVASTIVTVAATDGVATDVSSTVTAHVSTAPTTLAPSTAAPTASSATQPPESTAPGPTEALTVPALGSVSTTYSLPSPDPGSSWGDTHSGYPATDIFVPGGCGGTVVSPVDGVAVEVRRENRYDPTVDNPALRGGRSVTIVGDDGVRYYLAHFATIEDGLEPGTSVTSGQPIGSVGDSGRTSACHIHFGISPPCPDREWSVRRGAIWPYPYLDAWRRGEQRSPVDEIAAWLAANPDACADAATDPHADDA